MPQPNPTTESFMPAPKAFFRAPQAIFWVGFGLRVACVLIGRTYRIPPFLDHFGFGWEMGRIGRSLATGQGFANPFYVPSGPTAWTPPLFPLLIALAFKLFGVYSNAAALFLMVCDSVFSALIAPAVYEIAARCFDAKEFGRRASTKAAPVALWSAWLWAVYPAALQYAIHWIWEMSLSTCLFTWAIVAALRLRASVQKTDFTAAGTMAPAPLAMDTLLWSAFGLLWGLLLLSNASLVLCLPAMMVWVAWPLLLAKDYAGILRVAAGAAIASVVIAVALTPWIVRNERVLHGFVPTRSNFGVELYESTLEANDGFPWGISMPMWAGDPEFQRYERMGELAYSRARGEEATARIRANPGRIVRWTVQRFFFFWDGTPHPLDRHPSQEYLRQLNYGSLSACGLLGLALMLRRRVQGAGLFALVFALVPVPYYLVTVQARFRHPIEPLIAVLGVYLFRSTEKRQRVGGRE